ncbi:MAG: DUF512 domain-containing protein [Bacillota bacterium]
MKKINNKMKWLLLDTVQKQNILPLTSSCNMSCIFCSHKNNPPGINTYRLGPLSLELIKELIEYLSPEDPVTLGESATKIIEGEPFSHPQFKKIIRLIRKKFSNKKIIIATNGSFLSQEIVDFLKEMYPVELNLSLNCATIENRKKFMGDKNPEKVFRGLIFLKDNKIPFNGSIVAMPHISGWDSLQDTIEKLDSYSPRTIRVFMPGYTKYTGTDFKFNENFLADLRNYINEVKTEYETPILLEPPLIKDLKCKVAGVISGTSAARAGIKSNDIITKINSLKPLTRVEAYHKINKMKDPELKIKRNKKIIHKKLNKIEGDKSGIVFNMDISRKKINELKRRIKSNQYQKIIIITSKLATELMEKVVTLIKKDFTEVKLKLLTTENDFFGGSIMCAGLLVTDDIIKVLKKNKINEYEVVFLPEIIYDIQGKDLKGESFKKIIHNFNLEVQLV